MLDKLNLTQSQAMTITIITVGVILLLHSFLRRVYENQLRSFLEAQAFEAFDATSRNLFTVLSVPSMTLEYYKLTSYLMREDRQKIDISFAKLIKFSRKNKKLEFMKQAFSYYMNADKKKCTEILEQIRQSGDQQTIDQCNMMYDIEVLKKSDYIDSMLKEYQTADEGRKAVLEYLLSLQYGNKGDKKNARKYEELSRSHFEKLAK